jgi:MFS transporter, ENTS family, enterobactin (siderophore) exporter
MREAEPGPDPSPDAEPLGRNRDFRLLVISQGVSSIGDMVAVTVLPLLILALTGSGIALGVVFAIQAATDFGVSMFAGAIVDRANRKRILVTADIGRAVLTALIPLSVVVGAPTMAVIVLVAAPLRAFHAFFRAAYVASLPGIVGRSHLARANGIVETVESTSMIIGPAIAGLLAASIGAGLTLGIDAASFAVSAVGLLLIKRDLRAAAGRRPSRILDDVREGFAYVLHDPVLRATILLFSAFGAVFAPLIPALAVRITRDLSMSDGVFGLVLSAYGVGAVGGSLAMARLGRRTRVVVALLAGIFSMGLVLIGIALVDALAAMLGLALLAGLAESIVTVTYVTIRTLNSPDELLGRVGSSARVVTLGLGAIGLLVGGVLIDTVGGTETIAIVGGAMCLLALAFVPVRALRTATLTAPTAAAAPDAG